MTNENSTENKEKIINEIIQTGSEISGGAVGAIAGSIIAGPVGGIIGGAVTPILIRLFSAAGQEIKQRVIGEREKVRIGYTYGIGYKKISDRLENGETMRSDNFFDSSVNNRSTADEILEGVIRSAEKEIEEKKLKFYGNLLANISFTTTVNKDKAHFFIKIAQDLTYKQLCILQFFETFGQQRLMWGHNFAQLDELSQFGALEPLTEDLDNKKLVAVLRTVGLNIGSIAISKLGKELVGLMELSEIESEDIRKIENEFREVKQIIEQKK